MVISNIPWIIQNKIIKISTKSLQADKVYNLKISGSLADYLLFHNDIITLIPK
jgi:hypothetical protein